MTFRLSALAILVCLVPAAGAAQNASGTDISIEQAQDIARKNGIVRITESDRDGRRWEIEGRDQSGRKLELKIDARTGAVLKRKYDD
jgi:uncharacterized membrane protein YkoI